MNEKKPSAWRWKLCSGCMLVTGLTLVTLGVAMMALIIPGVVRSTIVQQSQLVEGSRIMRKWMNPEYKMQFKVFVFSVRNPDEMMAGEVPEVKMTGPYTFDKSMEHKVVSAKEGRVKYRKVNRYNFNERDSCQTCILGNRVWIPNLIYQKFVEAASTTGMRAAATTLLSQTAFLEVEVGELLFEGYKDPFLDKICEIPFMDFICDSILDLPDRIGFFYEKNNTVEGVFEVLDGTEKPEDLGKVVSFNGRDQVDEAWWSSTDARAIRGTDGSLFPPFIQKTDRLWIFVTQLCRSVWLEYLEEIDYRGIPAYRFMLPETVLDTEVEGNEGFCNPTEKRFFESQNDTDNGCWPKGLLEISKCQRSQPPIMVSLPNFLFSTQEVRDSVKGLNEPNPKTDAIIVDIEPRTGVVLSARRRSQVNVEMWKGIDLSFPINLKKMRSSLVPVLAINEEIEIDDTTLEEIRSELVNTEWWAFFASKAFCIFGLGLLLLAILLSLYMFGVISRALCCFGRSGEHTISPLPNYQPKNATMSNGNTKPAAP